MQLAILRASIYPVLKLFILASIGAVFERQGRIPAGGRSFLGELIKLVFLPSLIFVQLGRAVDSSNILTFWPIPVNVILGFIVAYGYGLIFTKMCPPPTPLLKVVRVAASIANMGNLPLVLTWTICENAGDLFGDECSRDGTSFVAAGMYIGVILCWGFGYEGMRPPAPGPPEGSKSLEMDVLVEEGGGLETLVESRQLLLESKSEQHIVDVRASELSKLPPILKEPNEDLPSTCEQSESVATQDAADGITISASMKMLIMPKVKKHASTFQKMFMSPPSMAATAGVLVGMCPPIKDLFFGPEAPLQIVTSSLETLGGALIPAIIISLGASLSKGPGSSTLDAKTIVGVVAIQLVLMPISGVFLVGGMSRLGILDHTSPIFAMVLLIQHATPTAVNLSTIAAIHGAGEVEIGTLIFWEYIASAVTLPLVISGYFSLPFVNTIPPS